MSRIGKHSVSIQEGTWKSFHLLFARVLHVPTWVSAIMLTIGLVKSETFLKCNSCALLVKK